MTVPSIRNPNFQAIDSSGNPLEGGKLYVFEPGQITTAKTSYTDSELTAGQENTHPIILDSKGECELYYSGTARLRLFTSDDVLVDDWDNVGSSGDINTEWVSSLTPTFASSTSFTLSGDQTSAYHANRRIRATDSSTLYGYITSSSYSAPNTTVNVTLDSGSLSASLSEVSVGIISAINTSLPSNSVSTAINNATAKTTPVDADVVGLVDSAASNVLKKLSWANIKATLLTYFSSVTATFSNKTLTSPTINSGAVSGTFTGNSTFSGTTTLSTVDINAGAIDGTTIGASSAAAITGTTFSASGLVNIATGTPEFRMTETDAAADNGVWRWIVGAEQFVFRVSNDALSASANIMTVDRTGTTIDTVNIMGTNVQANGVAVSTNSTTSTHTCQQLELGNASDTTFTRPAAGRAQIEGREIVTATASATVLTSTIDELNILDGATVTTAELNELDDSAQAITDYESGVRHYIFSGALGVGFTFDVDANITEGTFESIGPTGSGATNIWDRLDDIPDGATAVILNVIAGGAASSADAQIAIDVSGRKTGSTTSGTQALIASTYQVPGSTSSIQSFNTCFVPIDSSKRFDIRWDATGDASRSIALVLVGFLK